SKSADRMGFFQYFSIVVLYQFQGADIQHKAICDTISRISNRNAPKTDSLVQPFLSFGAFETAFGATVFGFGAFETVFGATFLIFGAFETVFGASIFGFGAFETIFGASIFGFGAFETVFGASIFGFGAFETAFGATIFDFGAFEAVFGAIKTYPQKNIIKTISLPYIIKTS
ncbi:MAG: hypothetical protein IIY81_09870, partial [Lachnospiraceae bacterium]|nr:hypothetical protein [Lachnospiraceae bacterium]